MKSLTIKSVIAGFAFAICFSANAQKATDHLSVPVISFNSTNFKLSAAQQLGNEHYKQIYLPNNESQNRFNSRIGIEVVYTNDSIQGIFQQKVNELEALKKEDRNCKYTIEMNQATGEYLISFTTSNLKNEKLNMAEWNIYRYKSISGTGSTNGIMLFTYTKRVYGYNCTTFLQDVASNESSWSGSVKNFTLPNIKPTE